MQDDFDFEWINNRPAPAQPAAEITEPQAQEKPAKKKLTPAQSFFKDARDVLLIVCVFMLVYVLFFRAVVVVGSSMYDTLVSGDYLLVLNNLVYRDPQPGDIVVASKDSFRGGECIIKRVIATEGQVVDIDFTTGSVYVDGVKLDEPYIYSPTTRPEGMEFPLTVDEGCIFVMGDNRRESMDSRDPEIGLIDRREVLGKAIFLIFPGTGTSDFPEAFDLSRIGGLE